MAIAPSTKTPPEVWEEQLYLNATIPFTWVIKADGLIRAFHILVDSAEADMRKSRTEVSISSIPFMLAGFAIENLLKGSKTN